MSALDLSYSPEQDQDWQPFRREVVARESRTAHRFLARIWSAEHGSRLAWTTDLSARGLGIACDFDLSPGTPVTVSVTLSTIDTMPMGATVMWSELSGPTRMGLQLEQIDGRLRLLLTSPRRVHLHRLPRYRDQRPLRVGVGGAVLAKAFTRDLSARGVGLCGRILPPKGTFVQLEIPLPRGGLARAEGTVAWVTPPRPDQSFMTAGVSIRIAEEEFFQFVLERQQDAEQEHPAASFAESDCAHFD